MQWSNPIVYGTDRDHTKIYDKERHCMNCEEYTNTECSAQVSVTGKFHFKLDYPAARQRVYMGRVLAGVCHNYKLTGKEWDR